MVYVVFVYAVFVVSCNGQSGDNVTSLITKLFTTDGYMKNVRPNLDQTKPMQVNMDFYLVGINGIDEITQRLTTTGYLYIGWVDEYLKWDPSSYGQVQHFHISQNKIWKPAITVQNGFTKLNELGNSFINTYITWTGEVEWLPFEAFQTKCAIDITYFPFDRQTCNIIFGVWASSIAEVNVTKGTSGIVPHNLDENGMWSVVSTSASDDVEYAESRVIFTIILERNSGYYMTNVIVPVILLGILKVFTFVLPADSGEKIGYTMTVFLSFAVYLTVVSSELPQTSGSILEYYLLFQLVMGTFVIVVTAIELRLNHRKHPVPSKILQILKCRCKNSVKHSDSSDSVQRDTKAKDWSDVISTLDFILFWSTLFVEFIVTLVILGILINRL